MAEICGWIILMRALIAIIQKWCLWCLSAPWDMLIIGSLELCNGCLALANVKNYGLRFILCSFFLGFGGLCVALQTRSAASNTNFRLYLPGKFLQAWVSFLMAYAVQYIAFTPQDKFVHFGTFLSLFLSFLCVLVFLRIKRKKSCGILEEVSV